MNIYCADEDCSSRNRKKSLEISKILILIGKSYKCPYCRGFRFILTPNDSNEDDTHDKR